MSLKKIDFLSPPISIYYQRLPSHSSSLSGILSILSIAIIIFLSLHKLSILFKRDNETPSSTSFTYFVEDAGTITFNPSSLFHFISLQDIADQEIEEFDFSFFNAVGFEITFTDYATKNNIKEYDHWLYGLCNNETDIEGIEDIINTKKFFSKSACIRKYYNSKNGLYYDTNDPEFRYPSISHGTFNPKNNIYTLIIKECDQTILDDVFNGKIKCKNINEYNMIKKAAHFNFIDQYIDILQYRNPVVKYLYRIENLLDTINYSINYINLNPSMIKSNIGYLLGKTKEEFSYYYDRNDVLTYKRERDVYMGYSFFLNNRINYYERTYITIIDVFSALGGIINIVIFIMTLINNFVNSYIVLKDFNCLLNLFGINTNDINIVERKNILNKKLKQVETIKKNSYAKTRQSTKENEIKETIKEEDKDTITDQTLNTEKSENEDLPKVTNDTVNNVSNKEEKEIKEIKERTNDINVNDTVFSFSDFFVHNITFGKRYPNIEIFEKFRKKIISVEHLMHNYLKLNDLLKLEKRRSKTKN